MNSIPCYAQLHCPACGPVVISSEEYWTQLSRPDSLWKCPLCHNPCTFDDDYFEYLHDPHHESQDLEVNNEQEF